MEKLEEILSLEPEQFDQHWQEIDQFIFKLNKRNEQIKAWESIALKLENSDVSKGMPYFRLGIAHLLRDPDESTAIDYLKKAYEEDNHFGPLSGQLPHRMGAYRLLALTEGFFSYLHQKKNWEEAQLEVKHRQTLVKTLLAVYDSSLINVFDRRGHTYKTFFDFMTDKKLIRFAIENYFCAESLLEMFFIAGAPIVKSRDEYALARAIIGLIGGTLEAVLLDKLSSESGEQKLTLGALVNEAHLQRKLSPGTTLAALSSLMLYLRNHVHPEREIAQQDFFIDINVAKGCKVALDWAINEMPSKIQSA